MANEKESFEKLLSPLQFLLQLSDKAYNNYLQNKIYVHAETLRLSNKRIARLIEKNAALIPSEIKNDVVALMNHYDIWFTQFKLYKKQRDPWATNEFIFPQADEQSAFPREAVKHILQYYSKLKQALEAEDLVQQ